jgi:hypothetical protein
VGQLADNSFIVIVDAGRAAELRDRLMAHIRQSIDMFYPAIERTPASERPQLTFAVGLITSQAGPYADSDALKEAALHSLQSVV